MVDLAYSTDPLDEMEDVIGVFYGGRGQVGQQFVVTNRRLLMGPLDIGIATEIDAYVLNQALPKAGDLLKNVLDRYAPMSSQALWLRHIVEVQPTSDARLLKAPGLRITTDTGQRFDLGIVATPTTMNWKRENNHARDRAVQALRAAVEAAKAAPRKPV